MALSVSSLFTESQLQYPTGSEECRRVSPVFCSRYGRPGTAGLALIPHALARPVHPLIFHLLRLLRSLAAPQQQPQQLRRARSCSPSQKRSLHLHHSSAVFSSTSSTPRLHRLGLCKGTLAVFPPPFPWPHLAGADLTAANHHRALLVFLSLRSYLHGDPV